MDKCGLAVMAASGMTGCNGVWFDMVRQLGPGHGAVARGRVWQSGRRRERRDEVGSGQADKAR